MPAAPAAVPPPMLAASLPWELVLACVIAFVVGGVPFALVLVRLATGRDLRRIGSGNVGATNASRAFAARARLVVFLAIYAFDLAKGLVPVLVLPPLCGLGDDDLLAGVVVGASAILGHCYSPFLRLRGGKGVATTTGVLAALHLPALLAALAVFAVVLALTRRVYLGSLALGATLPVAVIASDPRHAFAAGLPLTLLCIAIPLFLLYTHRSNLAAARARNT